MGCNCGGGKVKAPSYVHTTPDGKKTAYGSATEAEAKKIRLGGTVSVVR